MTTHLPWYIAGPLIGLVVPLLLIICEKQFGISSSYRYILSFAFSKWEYFNYKRSGDAWQLHFALGMILAGIAVKLFFPWWNPELNSENHIETWQLAAQNAYSWSNAIPLLIGGVLVGFGARCANGCTAGHAIMGVSQFAQSSVVSTVAFFIGGLFVSYFIIPVI